MVLVQHGVGNTTLNPNVTYKTQKVNFFTRFRYMSTHHKFCLKNIYRSLVYNVMTGERQIQRQFVIRIGYAILKQFWCVLMYFGIVYFITINNKLLIPSVTVSMSRSGNLWTQLLNLRLSRVKIENSKHPTTSFNAIEGN